MFVTQHLPDCFRQLFALQALVVRLMLCQLLPRRGHQLFLLKTDHLRSKTSGNPVPRIKIKLSKPVRRLFILRNRPLLRVPLTVQRRPHERCLAIG